MFLFISISSEWLSLPQCAQHFADCAKNLKIISKATNACSSISCSSYTTGRVVVVAAHQRSSGAEILCFWLDGTALSSASRDARAALLVLL